eukprot:CAMPEP_0173315444 /NCGR_PEP_ID=MMETSP1143-20121109/25917_1 /TAXON_ID=483371 /ORGANISM="non described non described, Strain CCMP2298" /LENGTH=52 /DNA_ID=CAMNT_0014258203 /DNA_START=245 /DNA_END=403 /DNA_ORIENTATION=+
MSAPHPSKCSMSSFMALPVTPTNMFLYPISRRAFAASGPHILGMTESISMSW